VNIDQKIGWPFGRFWAIFGDFGRFWAILGDFGRFLAIFGDFGRFWAILGDFGRFWAIFFTNSFGHPRRNFEFLKEWVRYDEINTY
jgi:hypothetical protein